MRKFRKPAFFILITVILQLFSGISYTDIVRAEEIKEFKFITSIELTDFKGKPLGEEIDKSSEVRINFNFEIPNVEDVKAGEFFTVRIPKQIELISDFDENLSDEEGKVVAIAHFKKGGQIDIEFTEYTGSYSNVKGNFYLKTKFDRNNIGNGPSEKIEFILFGQSEPIVIEVKFKQDPIPEASISKKGIGYDGTKNEITWNIEFNKENVNVKSAKIIDNIPLGQEYIEGSATIDNGADKSGFLYEVAQNDSSKSGTLTYKFDEEVNKKHIISFKTRISDISVLPKEQGESIKLYNKAILDIDSGSRESNEASVNVKTNYIEKYGKYNSSEKKIDWTIKVNNNALEIKNLKIEDVIPTGLELIKDSFKVNNEVNNNYNYNEINKKLEYTFKGIINTQQIIRYSTKVVNEKVYQSNDTTNFKNTATIVEGLEGKPHSDATVGVVSNILRKSSVEKYDAANHYLTWKIEVNSNEVELVNPVVTDNIPVGQKYVDGSFKIDGLDADTNKFKYEPALEGIIDKTGTITYSFNETINKKYVITFKTEITDSSIYAGNVSEEYRNTATMNGSNIDEVNSTAEQKVTSNVIDKQSLSYNYVDKEITWKIIVNKNKTDLGEVVVTDNIKVGQEYVEGSAAINNNADNNGFVYTKANKDDKEKTGTLTYTFKDEISDTYEITFRTKVTDDSIFYTNGQKTINNKAEITGDVIPPNVSTEAERKIENSVINKSADYESGKDYIDWNVVINSNSISMGNVIIEDDLQEGLELDTTSIVLYKQTLNEDGSLVKGYPVELDENSVKYDVNTRKFIFNFLDEVNSPYLLTFRTNIVDKNKQPFTNTVNFKGEKTKEESTISDIRVEFQSGGGSAVGTRGTITVIKVDKDRNNIKLKGAKFNLLDKYKNIIVTGETDENGSLMFNKIKFDIPYYLEEVAPPEGYMLNKNSIHEFTIKSVDDSKNITRVFENSIIKANLELLKLDENNMALGGAEFTIYKKDSENEVAKGITDENGIVKFEKLLYGNYYYVETKAPKGYVLNSSRHYFTISENGVVLKETISNEKILGNIKVVKISEDNNFLANAEITLYDLEGNVVQKGVTDENGLVTFTNVPYGNYQVKETIAPEGYNLSEEVLKVSVDKEETGLLYEAGTITNTKIRANIKIKKLDQDGNKVTGAEFTLYNNDDEVIETSVTNEDGIALFKDIVYGEYYIKETKTPEGYIGSDEKIEVSVKENNLVYLYEVENTRIKGTIEIKKVDEDGNPLKGAEFTLYNKEGKEISKSISDENGLVRFEDVDYGKYLLKETKAPEGYIKDYIEVEVIIDSSKTQVFTFKNVKIKEDVDNGNIDSNNSLGKGDLPSTGDVFDLRLFILVGLALIVVGSGLLFKKKLKLNK
ncbi:SpaA isopeptide-forming pilin-related protein [Clostridium nigeriense]|uniref:SpaA isopeptide-forming pilin-related protein n=1 Tax=Clostridium nigeriense TaxID=1805470 RepID=UPI00082C05F4|nr:SpaA isopeptide-forming pilin-related protein [Clostridium nigeriense]